MGETVAPLEVVASELCSYDADLDRYTLTTATAASSYVAIDHDIARSFNLSVTYTIGNAASTGTGELTAQWGEAARYYQFTIAHGTGIAATYAVTWNDEDTETVTSLASGTLTGFAYNEPQTVRLEVIFDTLFSYLTAHGTDEIASDIVETSICEGVSLLAYQTIFSNGVLLFSATNTPAQGSETAPTYTHVLDTIMCLPNLTITDPVVCTESIFAKEYIGINWRSIADNPLPATFELPDGATTCNVYVTLGADNDTNIAQLEVINSSNMIAVGVGTDATAYLRTYTESGLALGTNGLDRVNIGVSGNVGIGTADAQYNLHVSGDINLTGTLYKNGEPFNSSVGDSIPIGTIMPYYSATVSDASYLVCDGATYNRSAYIELANALGVNPSATTFQVPDLRDKFLKGKNADAVGATGGSATKTLTEANMPAHSHSGTTAGGGQHTHIFRFPRTPDNAGTGTQTAILYDNKFASATLNYSASGSIYNETEPNHTHTFTTDTKGSGTAFDILPPYTTVIYIIKAKNNQYVTPIRDGDYWTNVADKLFYQSGNVGIGTNNPQQILDVNGTIKGTRVLGVDYNDLTNKPTITNSQWVTNGTTISYTSGSVGIGTTAPVGTGTRLDVAGNIFVSKTNGNATRLQIQSGNALVVQGPSSIDSFVAFGGVQYTGYFVSITGATKIVGNLVVEGTISQGAFTPGAVGTYALLGTTSRALRSQGAQVAGSSLRQCNIYGSIGHIGLRDVAAAGTWVLIGQTGYYNNNGAYTSDTTTYGTNGALWYRIS